MVDLQFDITTREIVMANGDFVVTNNPDGQNAGIIQFSRVAFLRSPIFGIGMEQVINADLTTVTFEMNRWKQQMANDGAIVANYKALVDGNQVNITIDAKY